MKLLFKQRPHSFFDSFDVYDESGKVLFIVKGVLFLGGTKKIYNSSGIKVGSVEDVLFSVLPQFRMYVGENLVGKVKKKFSFPMYKYSLHCNNWKVEGDFIDYKYKVLDGERTVMSTLWKTDTCEIDVALEEDMLYSLMILIAIKSY